MNAVQKLRQVVGEIRGAPNPLVAGASWELAERLLGRMPTDGAEVKRVCSARDIPGLDAIVSRLENPGAAAAAVGPAAPAGATAVAVSADEMDAALRAFRKRLKVMRLADESKLGGRQLSGGKQSEIDAIMPPHEFSRAVWDALAAAGRLEHTGQGFFMLPK